MLRPRTTAFPLQKTLKTRPSGPFCDAGSGLPGWEARFLLLTEHAIRSHRTVTCITSRLPLPAENEIDITGKIITRERRDYEIPPHDSPGYRAIFRMCF